MIDLRTTLAEIVAHHEAAEAALEEIEATARKAAVRARSGVLAARALLWYIEQGETELPEIVLDPDVPEVKE
jgi:hypothetical protein